MFSSSFTTKALLFLFLTSIVVYLTFFKNPQSAKKHFVLIGQKKISVEIAHTDAEVKKGLSYRNSLAENSGMYFVFDKRQTQTFWMNAMKFPLDIIWIDQGRIVGVEKNAPVPTTVIPTFTSPAEVTNVLEVNAGFFDKNHLHLNDSVKLTNE